MADKYVVDMSLSGKGIKHIDYLTRGQKYSNLWYEYRKEKLTVANFYISAVNRAEVSKKIRSSFCSTVKISSIRHGITNESVVLTKYVSL